MNYIHYLDLFGATYTEPYEHQKKIFRTKIGAFFTIGIYSLSLMYFIYEINLWVSGDLNPKTALSYEARDSINMNMEYQLLKISFNDKVREFDPFNKVENILSVYLIDSLSQIYELPVINNTIIIENLNISLGDNQMYSNGYMLKIEFCNPNLQNNCASQEKMTKFKNLTEILMLIQTNLLYFNSKDKKFIQIPKTYACFLQTENTQTIDMLLQLQQNQIVQGFLFDDIEQKMVINDAQFVSQSVKYSFNGIFAFFTINLSYIVQIQKVQYPKISEILAQVGSIVSLLMMLKIFAVSINEYLLQEQINLQIIGCYYPQFRDLKIEYDVFGKIKQVWQFGKKINLNEFQEFYKTAKPIAEKKQTLTNLVYEISRLQFLIQQLFDPKKLEDVHKLGIQISMPRDQKLNAIGSIDEDIEIQDSGRSLYLNEVFNLLTYLQK